MKIQLTEGRWLNTPKVYNLQSSLLRLTTEPCTDFWQRSYYGMRNDSAPALLFDTEDNFTFSCQVCFDYQTRFDQCGVCLYLDSENWFKASIEFENSQFSRLGSVVTNAGYSDWATRDIATSSTMWYRLSRRGPDFLIEASNDGVGYEQMRIFHLQCLGETTPDMGKANPPLLCNHAVSFGLYACSPADSSFEAVFSDCHLQSSTWLAHA